MDYRLLCPDSGPRPSGLHLRQTAGTVAGPRGPPAPPRPLRGLPRVGADFIVGIKKTHVRHFFLRPPLFTASHELASGFTVFK